MLSVALAATGNIRVSRVPADSNFLFPKNAKRLTKFMMDETYGILPPFSAAWAQRAVLDAAADSDFYSRLKYYHEARTSGRPCGSIIAAEREDGSLCGFADVGASLWLPNDRVFRLPMDADLQRLASTGIGADSQFKRGVELRPYVSNLVVDASVRRSGVGRKLMAACEDDAREWMELCSLDSSGSSIWLEVSTSNTGGLAFYRSLGYTEDGRTAGDEVQRQGSGFGMVRVERCVMQKVLKLKGGWTRPASMHLSASRSTHHCRCPPPAPRMTIMMSRRSLTTATVAIALWRTIAPQGATAFPPPVGDVELLLPLLQCRELIVRAKADVGAARGGGYDWLKLQRVLRAPPVTVPPRKGQPLSVGSGFREASEAYDASLRYVSEVTEEDRAFCYVSKAVKVDQQCVQRLYTSDRTFRQLLRNQVLGDLQELEAEAGYLAKCAQSKTYASSGPIDPRSSDGIICNAMEDVSEVRELLDAALASFDRVFASVSQAEMKSGRERMEQLRDAHQHVE